MPGAGPIVLLIVAIVVISAVVGAIAQFLNKLNEANAPPPEANEFRISAAARGTLLNTGRRANSSIASW